MEWKMERENGEGKWSGKMEWENGMENGEGKWSGKWGDNRSDQNIMVTKLAITSITMLTILLSLNQWMSRVFFPFPLPPTTHTNRDKTFFSLCYNCYR